MKTPGKPGVFCIPKSFVVHLWCIIRLKGCHDGKSYLYMKAKNELRQNDNQTFSGGRKSSRSFLDPRDGTG